MRCTLTLVLGSIAWGCGKAEIDDLPVGTEAYEPAYREVCEARGLELAPSDGPNQHFHLAGQAKFTLRDSDRDPIVQQLEIALGGPARQRYQLEASGSKNWFLLASPNEAWKKLPGEDAVSEYTPTELAEDAWLRWLILRYPWETPDTASASAGPVLWSPPHSDQQFELRRDATGLPASVWRKNESGSQLLLEVEDWRADAEAEAAAFPRVWRWHRAAFVLEEDFATVESGVLYFDIPFRPTTSPTQGYRVSRHGSSQLLAPPSETFALVERSASWFDENIELSTLPRESWSLWRSYDAQGVTQGEWRFVEATALEQLPESIRAKASGSLSEQRCFYWASPQARDPQVVYERLNQAAADNGYQVAGPLWVRLDGLGLEALLPVKRD